MKESLSFVKLDRVPILQQLQYEEALLRTDNGNWCLLNRGVSPAIVLGISAKLESHVNLEKLSQKPIPVIRRFTGGGTVVVDDNTIFITFICNSPSTTPFPHQVYQWSESFYRHVFTHNAFRLVENDFTMGELKFGGNAQYMQKGRWLLHTSFLWDYNPSHMEYLCLPPKMPKYRSARPHSEFLCRLKDYYACQNEIENGLKTALNEHFDVKEANTMELEILTKIPHRKNTFIEKLPIGC